DSKCPNCPQIATLLHLLPFFGQQRRWLRGADSRLQTADGLLERPWRVIGEAPVGCGRNPIALAATIFVLTDAGVIGAGQVHKFSAHCCYNAWRLRRLECFSRARR